MRRVKAIRFCKQQIIYFYELQLVPINGNAYVCEHIRSTRDSCRSSLRSRPIYKQIVAFGLRSVVNRLVFSSSDSQDVIYSSPVRSLKPFEIVPIDRRTIISVLRTVG